MLLCLNLYSRPILAHNGKALLGGKIVFSAECVYVLIRIPLFLLSNGNSCKSIYYIVEKPFYIALHSPIQSASNILVLKTWVCLKP